MTSYDDIPPFFEPRTPPPAVPNLLAQTEVGRVHASPRLLAQEELGPGYIRASQRSRVRFAPYATPPKEAIRRRPPPPPSSTIQPPRFIGSQMEDIDSDSPLESDVESEGSGDDTDKDEDEDGLIPSPGGGAGRPGRGGYNLEEALGLPKKDYQKLKKYVKNIVQDHLDTSKSMSSQPLSALTSVQALITKKFPFLNDYAGLWPIADLIQAELKYTSRRARIKTSEQLAKVGKAVRGNIEKVGKKAGGTRKTRASQ